MPKIEMLANCQAGGQPHFIGEVVEVPEDSARAVVRAGKARLVDAPEQAAEPDPEAATKAEPEDAEPGDAEPEPPQADEPDPEPEPEPEPEPPKPKRK